MVVAQTNREIIYIITVGEEKLPANSSFSTKSFRTFSYFLYIFPSVVAQKCRIIITCVVCVFICIYTYQ
jgi:hypothetical protein